MQAFILWFQLRWQELQDWLEEAKLLVQGFFKGFGKKFSATDEAAPANRRWLKRILKWSGYALLVLLGLFILIVVIGLMFGGEEEPARRGASDIYGYGAAGSMDIPNPLQGMTLASLVSGFTLGAGLIALLAFWRWVVERHGWLALVIFCALLVLIGETSDSAATSSMASMIAFIVGLFAGAAIAAKFLLHITPPTEIPNVFGSSRWATPGDLKSWNLLGKVSERDGLILGHDLDEDAPIIYRGDMHALTVAPTRTGKGASAIIPNLLRSSSSVLVIDPKGENARRTAAKRAAMGQKVFVVDPWGVSLESDQYGPGIDAGLLARFNPLANLKADDPDLGSDAMLLADALVVSSDKDPFWTDEAKALIAGFILYVVTAPEEEGNRTLARVRDILSLPPAAKIDDEHLPGTLDEILLRMASSAHPLVSAAAFRLSQKAEKERSGVISSAQANTHFLDSPMIRKNLSGADFAFSDMKTGDAPVTVYLVLPLDRLPTFNRWLRLMISSALIDLTREPANHSREPVRVILDEFAALERLAIVETAFGTMAGLGVQLWAVTQDLSQLQRLYGDKGWQTFVSNAGVFQYFGSRDYETAKYAEHLTGMTTMKKRSISFGSSTSTTSGFGPGGSSGSDTSGSSETISYDDVQRPLAYADEMMTMHRDRQILFIENRYPIIARKRWWFEHEESAAKSETKKE